MDDILIAERNKTHIQKHKAQLKKKFDMKDLGEAKKILGMEITQDRFGETLAIPRELRSEGVGKIQYGRSKISHHSFGTSLQVILQAVSIITKEEEKISRVPYASAVGSLMYAMVCTRLDLAYAVSEISQFMSNPGKEH